MFQIPCLAVLRTQGVLSGTSISSSQVSRASKLLDGNLHAWRNRLLGEFVYLCLDACYERVRQNGPVRDAAILIAMDVDLEGSRQILGVSASLGEQEVHWRPFLQSLLARGSRGVQLVISDDHASLKAARIAVFGGIPWQRCQSSVPTNVAKRGPPAAKRRPAHVSPGNAMRSG